jgi:hypothetical protein
MQRNVRMAVDVVEVIEGFGAKARASLDEPEPVEELGAVLEGLEGGF